MRSLPFFILITAATLVPTSARAVGEKIDGFPDYRERLLHQLVNRDRSDPQIQLGACGPACSDKDCYAPRPPLQYSAQLNRAARFHADEMAAQNFLGDDSICTLVADIAADYPDACNGAAACACVGGVSQCMPVCDSATERVARWGAQATGELVAATDDPDTAYLGWLFVDAGGLMRCGLHPANADRFLLLQGSGAVGFGVSNGHAVADIGTPGDAHPIASGSHWPRQGPAVQTYASWHDIAAPKEAHVNVDGECIPLELDRGSPESGAYSVHIDDLSPGCHRYFFTFVDSGGVTVTYPTTGSLVIGPEDDCPDFSDERPPNCGCNPSCGNRECGNDGCGGSCGTCGVEATCFEGSCCIPFCEADQCGWDGCGGECLKCEPGWFCNFDFCEKLDEATTTDSTTDTTGDDTTGAPMTTGDDTTGGAKTTGDAMTGGPNTTSNDPSATGGLEPQDPACSCRDGHTSSRYLLALVPLLLRRRRRHGECVES